LPHPHLAQWVATATLLLRLLTLPIYLLLAISEPSPLTSPLRSLCDWEVTLHTSRQPATTISATTAHAVAQVIPGCCACSFPPCRLHAAASRLTLSRTTPALPAPTRASARTTDAAGEYTCYNQLVSSGQMTRTLAWRLTCSHYDRIPSDAVPVSALLVTPEHTCLPAGLAASACSLTTTSAPVDQAVAMAATAPTLRAAVTALPVAAGG
jgi:hypothetical protein